MSVTFNEFDHASKAEWIERVNIDLKGKKTAEECSYFVEPGIEISPFVTSEDIIHKNPISGIKTNSGVSIRSFSDLEDNRIAHQFLSNGVEAIEFNIDDRSDFHVLFDGILLDLITIILNDATESSSLSGKLNKYLSANYRNKNTDIIIKGETKALGCRRILIDLTNEMTFMERLTSIKNALFEETKISDYKQVVIKLSLKKDFLAQIAELRAIRFIWDNTLAIKGWPFCGLTIVSAVDHSCLSTTGLHPLIGLNYLLMSGYLGMSDIVFGVPYEGDYEMSRLSLNIQHIFKEESFICEVTDPTAGSYVIEALTDKMVKIAMGNS